jgi:hypothetical protein
MAALNARTKVREARPNGIPFRLAIAEYIKELQNRAANTRKAPMRPITTHAINPCNEAIKLSAIDDRGPGGANHSYHINTKDPGESPAQIAYEAYCTRSNWKSLVSGADLPQWHLLDDRIKDAWDGAALAIVKGCMRHPTLVFQNGPVKENGEGVNGLTHEVLLAILIDRLRGFQAGPYACPENALALSYIEGALAALNARRRFASSVGQGSWHGPGRGQDHRGP